MENVVCHVEECKYNNAKGCSARGITVATCSPQKKASSSKDTACERFECRSNC